jgi:hypothetical protein
LLEAGNGTVAVQVPYAFGGLTSVGGEEVHCVAEGDEGLEELEVGGAVCR